MNKRGFTIIELLATLIILGIVTGIVIVGVNINLDTAKEKTEEVFIGTIKDAIKMYLDSDAKKLKNDNNENAVCTVNKALSDNVKIYKLYEFDEYGHKNNITLEKIINSKYIPLLGSDLVNPNNEGVECDVDTIVNIYRDDDYVYYYKISKSDIGCLTLNLDEYITNLPDGCSH